MGCLRLRGSARAMDMAKLCHDQAAWWIRRADAVPMPHVRRQHDEQWMLRLG